MLHYQQERLPPHFESAVGHGLGNMLQGKSNLDIKFLEMCEICTVSCRLSKDGMVKGI